MPDIANHSSPTPKRLVLSLLSVPELEIITVRDCARWGQLFDIEPAAMRVSIGRLVKAGFLRSARRGVYRIGPRGESLSRAAPRWRDASGRLCRWSGDWIVAHTAHLGRSDRKALRHRERALRLDGFMPLQPDFWCRPANYREPLSQTRARLLDVGLENQALVMRVSDIVGADVQRLHTLWPRDALELGYTRSTADLRRSAERMKRLSIEAAARESFLLGENVIRQVNADPLLPEQMVDVRAREELVETMVAYDAQARQVWQQFMHCAAAETGTTAPQIIGVGSVAPIRDNKH